MSRIAGLLAVQPDSALPLTRDALLAGLPGSIAATRSAGRACFGWKGRADRSAAAQLCGDAASLVAIDGAVLNADALRQALPAPDGDAALIAALCRQHGFAATLAQLEGDFAIACYLPATDTLWLARDRFGVKPMYYACLADGGIAFASQPSALLRLDAVPATPDSGFVARFAGSHYRSFDNLPERSPYQHIAQLPAGHFLACTGGSVTAPRAYWSLAGSLANQPDFDDDAATLAERYRELLLAAVGRRTARAGRPIFTLSGGLDSSSVLCCAARIAGSRQPAISCVYADATYDERHEIADVVDAGVAHWSALEIPDRIDLLGTVERMVAIHGEPVATATWLSHHLLAQHVGAAGFDALFGGLGGDELNAGEYEYFPMHFADLAAAGDSAALAADIAGWSRHHDHPIFRKSPAIAAELMARLTDPQRPGHCRPDNRRLQRYADCVRTDYHDLAAFVPVMDAPFRSYLKNRTFQDLFRETLPCCLRAEDRQCTAAGIEHYAPFLDRPLVEFMYRVPGTLKIRDGVTKQLLRRATAGLLPEATRQRVKKTGWNAPAHVWFDRQAIDALRDLIDSVAVRKHGIYDARRVASIIDEHLHIVATGAPQENHMMFLWQALNLSLWLGSLD